MKMKLLSALIFTSAISFAGIVPEKTAMYYEANYYKYRNKEISINVSAISPSIGRDRKLRKGYRYFSANTYDGRYSGGRMTLLVPSKIVESLIARFGLLEEREDGKTKTKLLRGVLKYHEDHGLYMVAKDAEKVSPFPSEGERNFVKDIQDISSSLSGKAKAAVVKYAKKLAGGGGDETK